MTDQELYYDEDDFLENQPCEDCPKCGRTYNDIDYYYQICSKCGWDEENKKFGKKIEPTEDDFLNGDADILTGTWL